MKRLALLLAAALACTAVHASGAAPVRASGAWIRVLPGTLPAGAYVTLHNNGDRPAVLRGARSTDYAGVMLHQSSSAGGMSRMRMVDALVVPAHGTAALAPGGYHLMLTQAQRPVQPGDTVQLELQFADGSTLPTDFIARPADALGPSH